MPFLKPLKGSLTRRFAVAAATLATFALMLITLPSLWLVERQQDSAVRLLNQREAEFHATTVSRVLNSVTTRLTEMANSSILATGLVDSAGRETYLTPFLNSVQQIGGVPIQILFTDFEGQIISGNGVAQFTDPQLTWAREQLLNSKRTSAIFVGDKGPELLGVELIGYNRTQTAEGALFYKVALNDLLPAPSARFIWEAQQRTPATETIRVAIQVPPSFEHLDLHLEEGKLASASYDLLPQYAIIFVTALILAGLVFILGWRLAMALTQDLRRLERFASAVVRRGFSSQRAEATGSTEVAGLARSINHMLDRLHEQHTLLQHETQKFHQLANTIPQLAWMANPDGWIHWFNTRWYEYTGTTPEQMEGWGWKQVHHPAFLSEVMHNWNDSMATGKPFDMTFPLRAADGSYHTFFTTAVPLLDASGKVIQWFGTNTDVTPLEEAEKALRESQARLKEGMVAARMVVWDWEQNSKLVRLSDNAESVLGCTSGDISELWKCVHPDDLLKLHVARNEAIEHKGRYHHLVRFTRPDNHELRWLEIRGTVQANASGEVESIRGVFLDVTERKRAEEELVEADRRKDEFLAMLAHELRNPLAPISAAAQLLKIAQHDESTVNRTSDIITRQVAHMTELVDDLLDVSRVTRGLVKLESEPVYIKDVIDEAVEQVQPLIRSRGHRLTLEMPGEIAVVNGDYKRLIQVLANLLNNAAKYTPEHGELTLRMQLQAQQVILSIMDNGIGIPPEMLPRVFELFTQAERSSDRAQGGLGLGLALVKSLVELHRGKVTAESKGIGQGATFTVYLPRVAASADTVSPPPVLPVAQHAQKPLRLLVVDDNQDAAQTLALFLNSAGHRAHVEHTPQAALEYVTHATPDACLLDIGLPGMDGNELARRLRELPGTAHAVLIAITGYGRDFDRETSMRAGFDFYFVKPIDTQKLESLLSELSYSLQQEESSRHPTQA
ncbi:ATP-binding protein [Oxalobacteraceae bacterium R-40]|uniref:histidine kinase n=1 Tax=Keguizhuia sedimenti TaxID=3064264 RepID=A0ABU1BSD4_9BURK|nr:ATP-binding protein [Oxalobacteraceae bacterium R-40]